MTTQSHGKNCRRPQDESHPVYYGDVLDVRARHKVDGGQTIVHCLCQFVQGSGGLVLDKSGLVLEKSGLAARGSGVLNGERELRLTVGGASGRFGGFGRGGSDRFASFGGGSAQGVFQLDLALLPGGGDLGGGGGECGGGAHLLAAIGLKGGGGLGGLRADSGEFCVVGGGIVGDLGNGDGERGVGLPEGVDYLESGAGGGGVISAGLAQRVRGLPEGGGGEGSVGSGGDGEGAGLDQGGVFLAHRGCEDVLHQHLAEDRFRARALGGGGGVGGFFRAQVHLLGGGLQRGGHCAPLAKGAGHVACDGVLAEGGGLLVGGGLADGGLVAGGDLAEGGLVAGGGGGGGLAVGELHSIPRLRLDAVV